MIRKQGNGLVCVYRIIKGGSLICSKNVIDPGIRFMHRPVHIRYNNGFRVAMQIKRIEK